MKNFLSRQSWTHALFGLLVLVFVSVVFAQSPDSTAPQQKGVKVVFLGTGVPIANPDRQGPSLAVVVNGQAYLVDAGTGIVRQAYAAYLRGISGLRADKLTIAFITHLHEDHTLGIADLILTPWMEGRAEPLQMYGPVGLQDMVDNILAAYKEDIGSKESDAEGKAYTKRESRPASDNPSRPIPDSARRSNGHKVVVHEIQPGPIYKDQNVQVTAFLVTHDRWKEPLGYRFDAQGKVIVISGDTTPSDAVIQACNGCDVLVHEAFTGSGFVQDPGTPFKRIGGGGHTPSKELGKIASKAKTKMLVVTHWIPLEDATQDDLLRDIRENYSGPVVIARDLDVVTP